MARTTVIAAMTLMLMQAPAGWRNGPPFGPNYFPIAVWLQDPANAQRYKDAGFNLYVGLWQGPTEKQLAELKAAGMPVICEQNAVGLAHRDDRTIVGWMHQDEPDNAQPVVDPATGKQEWGPCVPPQKIVEGYQRLKAADPTRPVLLNLGQGVINDKWVGRGPGASLSDYETYVQGADIVSFDVYPVAGLDRPNPVDFLWYVGGGVERLVKWTGGKKIVWNCLECTRIDNGVRKPTPEQVRAEAWMAIIHGSRGFIYFVHEFKPKFNEHALLDDPEMLKAVTELNREVTRLAPFIQGETVPLGIAIKEPRDDQLPRPVAAMGRRSGRDTYVFAVGMRNAPCRAAFALSRARTGAVAEVVGENRTIPLVDGRFEDAFAPHQVHIYRVR